MGTCILAVVLCLTTVVLGQNLIDILGGSPALQQLAQPRQQQQQQQQQASPAANSMFNVNALPNSVGQSSFSPGVMSSRNTGYARPYCRQQEKRILFDNCAMTFGMAHMNSFSYLAANAPQCRVDVFQCSHVDSLVRCINSQPVRVISNQCWPDVKNALTEFLRNYQIPCRFQDIEAKCRNSSADFLTVEQRPVAGVGINNNPLSFIMPIVQRIAMPLMMMSMNGGGLGAMFGF